MIRSMTAYARSEAKGEWGSAAWELRSVNQLGHGPTVISLSDMG